jgi:hypothetical protein
MVKLTTSPGRSSRTDVVIFFTVLPRRGTGKPEQRVVHDLVQRDRETVAGGPPRLHVGEPEVDAAGAEVEGARVGEVLVRDGVAPPVELLQASLPLVASRASRPHQGPKVEAEPPEVGADVPRIGVAGVELARLQQPGAEERPGPGRDGRAHLLDRLGMEVATEALELRGEQDGIGVVDLHRGDPAAATAPAERRVGGGDVVQLGAPLGVPAGQRVRRHPES